MPPFCVVCVIRNGWDKSKQTQNLAQGHEPVLCKPNQESSQNTPKQRFQTETLEENVAVASCARLEGILLVSLSNYLFWPLCFIRCLSFHLITIKLFDRCRLSDVVELCSVNGVLYLDWSEFLSQCIREAYE